MAEFNWPGASQKEYGYWAKPLPYTCNPDQDGNYIFCKIVAFPPTAVLRGSKVKIMSWETGSDRVKVRTRLGTEIVVYAHELTDQLHGSNKWVPVYIGQGDLNDRVNDPEHYNCARRKGATHVHVHTNKSEEARLEEEQDLLAAFPQAFAPNGCNQKPGG